MGEANIHSGGDPAARSEPTGRPVIASDRAAFVELFEDNRGCRSCRCIRWWIGPAHRRRPATANRRDLFDRLDRAPSPGLLARLGGTGVASTFRRCGVETLVRRTPARPIMRRPPAGADMLDGSPASEPAATGARRGP